MKSVAIAIVVTLFGSPAIADPAREGVFYDSLCHSCHVIRDTDGTLLAGLSLEYIAKKGPNLFGVIGRPAGSREDFKYSDLMKAARDKGLVWTEEEVVKFLENPTNYLRAYTGLKTGNSEMSATTPDEHTRAALAKFLASDGPPH